MGIPRGGPRRGLQKIMSTNNTGAARIGVAMKWVDLRPEVDPLTGTVLTDARFSGASGADQAALELALQLGELWGSEVVAVTVGCDASEVMLRDALAAGAGKAVRVDVKDAASSQDVARVLAETFKTLGVDMVLCGDWSLDRGSGSVPAFLAGAMGFSQALGLVNVSPEGTIPHVLNAERRLDGGRRERLRIQSPAIISVESGAARLRRAPLSNMLAAQKTIIEVHAPPAPVGAVTLIPTRVGPYRPRARTLPPPSLTLSPRERVLALTGALVDRTPPQTLVLDAPQAATHILDQLRTWGYLA